MTGVAVDRPKLRAAQEKRATLGVALWVGPAAWLSPGPRNGSHAYGEAYEEREADLS